MRFLKNHFKKLHLFARDVLVYFRLTSHGNITEHKTNFAKPDLKPVLLIHGFGTTRRSMSVLETRLRRDGYDVFSVNVGGFMGRLNTRGIDAIAKTIKAKVDDLSARYKMGKIIIIGHSKGGLIGRYYVSKLDGALHTKMLITLGTPHKGAPLAWLAALTVIGLVSRSVWQMMPHSFFMYRLNKTPIPESVETISIFSTSDTVVPAQSSRLDMYPNARNIKNIELSGFTHTDYLIKRAAYDIIKAQMVS